jgi:hypothetical protein
MASQVRSCPKIRKKGGREGGMEGDIIGKYMLMSKVS